MIPWSGGTPNTFAELFQFYNDYVKLLYSSVQTQNSLPSETLFELNAALDHMSRHWVYGEPEVDIVHRAYGHLKRSCLDIFKIKVKEARKQLNEIKKVDTSIIDNGDYDRNLNQLFHEIQKEATLARQQEGNPHPGIPAFALWEAVYVKCVKLEEDFYLHPRMEWAKRRTALRPWVQTGFGVILTLLLAWAWDWLKASYHILPN